MVCRATAVPDTPETTLGGGGDMADGHDSGRDGHRGWYHGRGGHGHANNGLTEEEAFEMAMALSLSLESGATTSTLSSPPPPPRSASHDWVSPVSDRTPLPSAPPAHVAGRHSSPATGTTNHLAANGVGGGVRQSKSVVPGVPGEGSGHGQRRPSRSGYQGAVGAAEIADMERQLARLRREAYSPTTRHRERTRLRSEVDASAAQLEEDIARGLQEVAALRRQSSDTSANTGPVAWHHYSQTSMASTSSECVFI